MFDVNANGVLFTAQAAGREMVRFGNAGSIILIASMSGSITNKVRESLRACVRACVRASVRARVLIRRPTGVYLARAC